LDELKEEEHCERAEVSDIAEPPSILYCSGEQAVPSDEHWRVTVAMLPLELVQLCRDDGSVCCEDEQSTVLDVHEPA
jgi:hypothetical protein